MTDSGPALYPYNPDYAVHPGAVIREMREEAGMKQAHLAGACRVSPKHMNEVEGCKKSLSAGVAVAIEMAFGVPVAPMLMRMQSDYDVFHAREAALQRAEADIEALRMLVDRGYPSVSDQPDDS